MAYLMQGLINHYPGARIYVLINNELSEEVTNSMKTIADRYGIPYIQLKDIDKKGGHPSIKGMSQIADQILKTIKK